MAEDRIFDFHSHPSSKPFNSSNRENPDLTPDPDLWRKRFRKDEERSKLAEKLQGEVNFSSQVHLHALHEGNIRAVCLSLYPLEKGFTEVLTRASDITESKIAQEISDKVFDKTAVTRLAKEVISMLSIAGQKFFKERIFTILAYLLGYDIKRVKDINTGKLNYFNLLEEEYRFLVEHQTSTLPYATPKYKLVKNAQELLATTALEKNTVAFFLSIEGAHVFQPSIAQIKRHKLSSGESKIQEDSEVFHQCIIENISKVKNWEYPPFMITYSHHFYNFLAGHAPSLTSVISVLLDQNDQVIVDKDGRTKKISCMDLGFTSHGRKALTHMLARKDTNDQQVRRMLIDTKHMSAAARLEYIQLVKSKRIDEGDHIPIIASHTGVNGRPYLKEGIELDEYQVGDKRNHRDGTRRAQKDSVFNLGSINLFDDEIIAIIQSDGMIGLMVDEKRIIGRKLPPASAVYTKQIKVPAASYDRGKDKTKARMNRRKYEGPFNKFLYAKRELKKINVKIYQIERSNTFKEEPTRLDELRSLYQKRQQYNNIVAPIFSGILLHHILHIIKVADTIDNIPQGAAWNHICLGTDYEGVINPIDNYINAGDLKTLKNDLATFWKTQVSKAYSSKNEESPYLKYLYHQGTQEEAFAKIDLLLENILWNNSMDFFSKYFTDEYLLHGVIPEA